MDNIAAAAHAASGVKLAQAAVDAVGLSLLVLVSVLRVVAANRSFRLEFDVGQDAILGLPVQELGNGRWDTPALRSLLDLTMAQAPAVAREFEQDIAGADPGILRFNARTIFHEPDAGHMILLAVKNVTADRACEREAQKLLKQKDILLQEMRHRIANSLQIIASTLMMKARSSPSPEARLHLQDAHGRVMAIVAVQKQLQASPSGDRVEIGSYLAELCESLTASMIADARPISLNVSALGGPVPSADAVSIGLIVTELVINALKYAFGRTTAEDEICVAYESGEGRWRLCVSDNGGGKSTVTVLGAKAGLGTGIIEALAYQLEARVEIASDAKGYRTTISHGVFAGAAAR